MTAETFWKVRRELYWQPSDDPTYYCKGCDRELDVSHGEGCPVGWFEARFFQPEFLHPKRGEM